MAVVCVVEGQVRQRFMDVHSIQEAAGKYGHPIEDLAVAESAVKVGWVLGENGFTAPDLPPPDPAETLAAERAGMVCSAFQARAALRQAGLIEQVQTAVDQADPFVQDAWEYATTFNRNSPTIAALAGAVGLTDEQIDDLFRAAMQIEA